jgi:predicted nucleotidyltransferase
MERLKQIKQILESQKEYLKEKYKIKEIGVFGSYVRGEQKKKSDIDILVEYEEVPDLFELVDLQDYLSEKLQIKVDLVLKSGLKPRIGKHILEEVVYI